MAINVRSLFPLGPDGDAEFEHAITTLVRRAAPGGQKPPIRLDAGWWLCGDDVCMFDRDGVEYGSKMQEFIKKGEYSGVIVVGSHGQIGQKIKITDLPRAKRLLTLDDDEWTRRFTEFEPFSIRYLQPATSRKSIEQLRFQYGAEFAKLYAKIQFVGMSVYKIEAFEFTFHSVSFQKPHRIPLRARIPLSW